MRISVEKERSSRSNRASDKIDQSGHDSEEKDQPILSLDLNATDECGNTQLHFAALNGDVEQVRSLIKQGADPYALNIINCTPATNAVYNGHLEIIKIFVEEAGKAVIGFEKPEFRAYLSKCPSPQRQEISNYLISLGFPIKSDNPNDNDFYFLVRND